MYVQNVFLFFGTPCIWCVVLLNVLLLSWIDVLHKFVHSMINSKNSTVRELITHFLTTESSVLGSKQIRMSICKEL